MASFQQVLPIFDPFPIVCLYNTWLANVFIYITIEMVDELGLGIIDVSTFV